MSYLQLMSYFDHHQSKMVYSIVKYCSIRNIHYKTCNPLLTHHLNHIWELSNSNHLLSHRASFYINCSNLRVVVFELHFYLNWITHLPFVHHFLSSLDQWKLLLTCLIIHIAFSINCKNLCCIWIIFHCYQLQLIFTTIGHHTERNLQHNKTLQTTFDTFDHSYCLLHC